jgi:hypothetical protein
MPTTVFLSSTFLDLEEHRRLARDAITRLEHGTQSMEFFGALQESPKEACLRLVRGADIYVGIFGVRYGSLDAHSGKSLTHLEYEEASALKLPCLVYLIDEDRHPVLPRYVEVGEPASKLADLKAQLRKNHVVSYFSSAQDLAAKLTQDLVRLLGARERAPTAAVLAHIAKNATVRHPLNEPRFRFLRDKVLGVFKQPPPDPILREAIELILARDNLAASFVLSRGGSMPLDDAVDALMEIEKIVADVIREGQRRIAEKVSEERSSPQGQGDA